MTTPYWNAARTVFKAKHEMPTLEGSAWPSLTSGYHRSESNIKPVEATTVELDYKIEELEREVLHQKTNFEQLHHANHKLIDEIREWEVKFKNSEFANRNLQAQVDKIPNLKRTIRWMMVEHLDIELGDE